METHLDWFGFVLWVAIVILVVLPPKWDPAIRLKEWQMRRRGDDKW